MSDAERETEEAVVARTRRKGLLLLLLVGLPMVVAAHPVAELLEQRFRVEHDLAFYGAMLFAVAFANLIMRLVIGRRAIARLRAIPGLRSSMNESWDRQMRWVRPVWIGVLLVALLLYMASMIFGPRAGGDVWLRWLLFPWVMYGGMLEPASLLPWSRNVVEDELAKAQRLDAAQHGYAVIIFVGVFAMVLDGYWPGHASSLLPIVLILGMLTGQISLVGAARRAPAGGD